MSKHMTIINLACTITKLRKWGEAWKHSAESAQAATAGLVDKLIADHEANMVEHRAAFGARTEADAQIIAGLRIQVQDMRAEMERLKLACSTYAADWATAGKACRMRDNEYPLGAVIRLVRDDAERAEVAKRLVAERDALRAEVAALQERLRASIARWDFAQMEIAALKSQTPKQHPVKVGEWVRRTVASGTEPVGTMIQVQRSRTLHSEYVTRGGWVVPWAHCEPCDPPSHDTEAGKAVAESAVRTEPVAEEIKVGDVVKVVGASGCLTAQSDIGKIGEVLKIDFGDGTVLLPGWAGWVNRCDVRKVTP